MRGKNEKKLRAGALMGALLCVDMAFSQQVIGTQGYMNIPSADMYDKKTFVGGVNYIAPEMVHYDYPTYDYFVGFTPFSFVELTFRSTLLKEKWDMPADGYYGQDRSFSVRLRPLAEKETGWWPSVVVGSNDFYSEQGRSFYSCVYGVMTKHFSCCSLGKIGATAGYSKCISEGDVYDGLFGGVDFIPAGCQNLRVMAEYDTNGFNVGADVLLFKHWKFLVVSREFKNISAGFAYQYTIKY